MIPRGLRRRRLLCVVAMFCYVSVLLVESCAPQTVDRNPPNLEQAVILLPFRLVVTGAVRIETRQNEMRVRRVMLLDARLPDVRYFGLEPEQWLQVGGIKVKPSVNVLGFAGDGRYEIPVTTSVSAKVPPTLPATSARSNPLSNARLDYVVGNDRATYRGFALAKEPCVVDIHGSGAVGRLHCPVLSDGSGAVSMVMSWG